MVEYSGLTPLQPVDWGKVAREASKPITDVIEERKQQRLALEQDKADSISTVNKYEQNKAPNGAEFVMNASQEGRSYVQAQYDLLTSGQITPEEYKRRTQNTRDSFKMLDTYMKTYQKDIEEAQARVDSGEAGAMEKFLNTYRGSIMDLKNKQSTFSDNGMMYVTGPNGTVYDLQSLNMGVNKRPQKVNIVADVDKVVKNLGIGAKMVNGKYVIANELVGNWDKTKEGLKKSLMDNPNKVASILADNVDPTGYKFVTDKKEAGGMNIYVATDENGIMVAQPTEEQRKVAADHLEEYITSRVKYEEKEQDPYAKDKINLEYAKLAYDNKKLAMEGGEERENYKSRIEAINDVMAGKAGIVVGQPMTYESLLGAIDEDKETVVKYAGYVINRVDKDGKGKYIVEIKNSEGKKHKLKYTRQGIISDLNVVFNNMKGEPQLAGSKINSIVKQDPTGEIDTSNY